jgi:two-component system chemotaxis response regulator CheY
MNMKALVVDDSRAMRMVLTSILKDCGFEVSEVGHGKDALTHLAQHPDTALALIDWNMPEMTGIELLGALKDDQRYTGLKRIMVTTESETGNMKRALDSGAHEYVMKPFTKAIIQDKLRLLGLL